MSTPPNCWKSTCDSSNAAGSHAIEKHASAQQVEFDRLMARGGLLCRARSCPCNPP